MKRKTEHLKQVALESLTLSVEMFNRPSPTARAQGVLLNLQHAFEMLFKAVIYEERGSIQPSGEGRSYSFRQCLGILRGAGKLEPDEALVAATADAHRDGVQHHGAEISEEQLYVDASGGMRVFDDLLNRMFGERLADEEAFAQRMLPVSADPPRELHQLISTEVDRIKELLRPPRRRHAEALPRLRTLVVSEFVADNPMDELQQPTEAQLERIGRRLMDANDWSDVFPGLAQLSLEHEEGATYSLRIVKRGDVPGVRVVRPGEPGAEDAVSVIKQSELDHYAFYLKDLAEKAGINRHNAMVLVRLLRLKDDPRYFKVFRMGKQPHERYSHDALRALREAVAEGRIEEARAAWREHRRRLREAQVGGAAGSGG